MNNMEQQFSEKLTISRHETQSSSSVREHSNSIPVDLLIEIFLRVPSKSIARSRCISKFWGSILRRPEFTELYMTRCPQILFTLQHGAESVFFSSPQLSNPEDNSCVVATRYNTSFDEHAPSDDYIDYITVECGLVYCMRNHDECRRKRVRVIWNPATGEFLTLPNIKPKIEKVFFGYDPINKKFKVLCMTSSNSHRVLTLENGKLSWRKIESEFDYWRSYLLRGEICIDGVLYFGCDLQLAYDKIVCFNVGSEKLSFINIDKAMNKKGWFSTNSTTLINYKGKVGIHERRSDKWDKKDIGFDLWVLEDAENHKWSKHIHLFPPLCENLVNQHRLYFIGMTSTGEMVFAPRRLSNPFYIFYYNLETKTHARVSIRGFEELFNEYEKENENTSESYYYIETFLNYCENMKLFK